jgi:anti-sigma regulatory factor (Ser/Thr protein kinase)
LEDLSLHILDIAENAIAARAKRIEILVVEEPGEDRLTIEIRDDGIGMDEEVSQKAVDPFFTTRSSRRVGLGLSFLAQAAQEAGGSLRIESELGKGTEVTASFQYHHIDRKPLGSMVETVMTLLIGNPELEIFYTHKNEGKSFALRSSWVKNLFKDRPLIDPEVIQWVERHLREGLKQIGVQG